MRRLIMILGFGILLMIPAVVSAQGRCLDPVTTYTNGMPLASSTPLRSHNAYYQCDPNRGGCCGGRYNLPCLNSLLWPNDCCTASRPAPLGAYGGETPLGGLDGVEAVRFQQLGSVPAATLTNPGGQPAAPTPTPTPTVLQQLLQ